MKEKIVFFHLLNNFTGSPQILRNVIEAVLKDGFEVVLYTSSTPGFLSDIPGVVYRSNFYQRYPKRLITLFTFFLSQLLVGFVILKYWRSKSVFYTNTILPFSAVLAGRLMGKRVITHVHENEVSPQILDKFLFWVVRNFSSEKVVVSQFLALNPKLGNQHITLIPNTVYSKISKHASQVHWSPEEFTVLMLASLRPYKGISEYVDLSNRLPEISFVLVLSDAPKEVNDWKSGLNFGSNLKIFPVQEEVIPFYQKAHLILNLAHPEEWLETFGMTVLEGFNFGLPAIVPTVGGVAELVEDGVNGFKIDYTDSDLQAIKISELAQNRDLWNTLSTGAFQKSKLYSVAEFDRKVLKLVKG